MTTNTDRDQEISELRAEVANLKAHNAALEQRLDAIAPKPAPPPREIRGVTITRPLPPPVSMPSDAELAELLRRVRESYATFRAPSHVSEQQDAEYFQLFRGAFRWLISIGRTNEPNTKYSYEMIVERCREHLRLAGAHVPVNYGSIFAAAIATGDICYDDPISAPFPWAYLGVEPNLHRTYAGAYKQILAGERDFLPANIKQRRAS